MADCIPRQLNDAWRVWNVMDAASSSMKTLLICFWIWVAVSRSGGTSIGSCVQDIPSRAARADIVLDGRVRARHSSPVWYHSGGGSGTGGTLPPVSYFNVTVRPRRVLKGWLQRDRDGAGYLPVVVGPFALDEDRVNCVPAVAVGARYVIFLSGNGSTISGGRSTAQPTTLFFQLSGFPAAYTSETASLARQYSCTGCSKYNA